MPQGTPWWQMTKTTRRGFMNSALGLAFGVFGLVLAVSGRLGPVYWGLAVLFLLFGIAHLASAVALRRRERSGLPGGQRPPARR